MPSKSAVTHNAIYKRQVYEQRLAKHYLLGTCVRCDNRAVPGLKHCDYHLDLLYEASMRKRNKRLAENKCPNCGREKDNDSRCVTCYENQRRWEKTRRKTPRTRNRNTGRTGDNPGIRQG